MIKLDLHQFDGNEDNERCAVILHKDGRYVAQEVPNRSDDPTDHYTIVSSDVVAAKRKWRGWEAIGLMHTHPGLGFDLMPSHDDVTGLPDACLGVIYNPETGIVITYDREGERERGMAAHRKLVSRDLNRAQIIDWLEFPDAEVPHWINASVRVNVNFLASNWQCIYGQGCPGIFPKDAEHTNPDTGCCTIGFWAYDEDDVARIEANIALMTEADWDADRMASAKARGWSKKADNHGAVKSRVIDRACIFSNRADGSAGKPGCAFLHLGNRLAEEDISSGNGEAHETYMPVVCANLPIWHTFDEDTKTTVLDAWSAERWGGVQPDGSQHQWMQWWCVDTPDAYIAGTPLYVRMKLELIRMIGEPNYNRMVKLIEERKGKVRPMIASTLNDGRPMLPLFVADRTPQRTAKQGDV